MSAPGPSGLLVVDKPPGMTSHDVVARARRLAGTRKVGHAGTLDPMATGVLLLGVNRATRLLGHLSLTEKGYAATVRLGAATTTDDAEGEVLREADTSELDEDRVEDAFAAMVGEIDQVPSAVSAVKVDGRRAYARVRAGEQVDLPSRRVRIDALDTGELRRVGNWVEVDITVTCSSGTYVRAIARDVGDALGVGGHLTALRRTFVGPFALDEAHTLEQLAERLTLVSLDEVAARCFPTYTVDEGGARDVSHGRRLTVGLDATGPVAVLTGDGRFLALYEQRGEHAAPVAVFGG